jgi:tetratricopeptide (TPR) repeat protein
MTSVFAVTPDASSISISASDVLDHYVADPAATAHTVAGEQSLSSILSALRRDGTAWMLSGGAGDANRRRLIAATFALDVAGESFETQPQSVPPIVEWGCEQVRKRLPSDAERQWQITAMAVLEGLGNVQAVEAHLAHARARFPAEGQWRQAQTWLADSRTLNVHPRQPLSAAAIRFPADLAAQYEALTTTPAFADDAWVRIGFLQFLSGNAREARAAFQRAESPGAPDNIRYLTRLFFAWMAEREARTDDAIREFTSALDAAPYGRTAAVWLAVRYHIEGRAADAERVAAEGLRAARDGTDPWRTFYGGDIRRWPELIAAARQAAR